MNVTDALALIGATDPGADTPRLLDLEARLGHRLPEETRALIRAAPVLEHPNATDHPEIDDDLPFEAGLPDVDAFLESLSTSLLGNYLSVLHFVGAVPVGVQLQYGDFMYAMARIEPWTEGLGGMMYFDEREYGTWGASIAAFLHQAVSEFRTQVDGQIDGMDEDELASFEPDLDDLRDCFILRNCDPRGETPAAPVFTPEETALWEKAWRLDMDLVSCRTWMGAFLTGNIDGWHLRNLPTRETWLAEKDRVGVRYADTMYWLLAHALLGNEAELQEALERSASMTSTHIRAVADAAPALLERCAPQREALYEVARRAG